MNLKALFKVFKNAFYAWLKDNATLRAAALTFFIVLPLPTLLLIVLAVFSQFLGPAQAIYQLTQQITAFAGPEVADLFSQLLVNAESPFSSAWTTFFVGGFSIIGAIGTFSVLRDSMNIIWEVKLPKRQPFWMMLRQKFGPFILFSVLALIVCFWTAIASGFFNLIIFFSINDTLTAIIYSITQVVSSFIVSTISLALIYKIIPEAKVHWIDVVLAAVVTGIAFSAVNYIFGTYIRTFTVTTVIGAAGSLLLILLWLFILNEIVLFGAEISKVYATAFGIHSTEPLPSPLDKIIEPIGKVVERIEQVTKDEYETKPKQDADEN
jgi:membrane protein